MASKLYVTKELKRLRESKSMTQEDFAGMMAVWLNEPVSLSMVQKWEQQQRPIKPEAVLEIANYFKVEPKTFVERR